MKSREEGLIIVTMSVQGKVQILKWEGEWNFIGITKI